MCGHQLFAWFAMENLNAKTAVITGGASGMGKAFARRLGEAGMNIVIADIEEPVLNETVAEFEAEGITVLGVVTDVSKAADQEALRDIALERFGQVNVLCLNAGVAGGNGSFDNLVEADWTWTLGVNLYGITHGLTAFLPHMKEHGDGHVVITASVAGLTSFPGMGPYNVSKHAAVAIAETLFSELRDDESTVGVSCLCPGLVMTGIFQSDRNRPETLARPEVNEPISPEDEARYGAMIELIVANAKDPAHVAELVHDAILAKQFWIYTDEDFTPDILSRLDSIRDRTEPTAAKNLLEQYE